MLKRFELYVRCTQIALDCGASLPFPFRFCGAQQVGMKFRFGRMQYKFCFDRFLFSDSYENTREGLKTKVDFVCVQGGRIKSSRKRRNGTLCLYKYRAYLVETYMFRSIALLQFYKNSKVFFL